MDTDKDGRREYSDSQFLDAVRSHDMPTTPQVARAVGCTQQGAYYRLMKLCDEGRVTSRKVGNSRVWSIS
jgi:hypothetical protein